MPFVDVACQRQSRISDFRPSVTIAVVGTASQELVRGL